LPFTAGGFIYIAGSDLIPELYDNNDGKLVSVFGQLICIILGIAVMVMLLGLER
jgi:zinc and cadmium transporter